MLRGMDTTNTGWIYRTRVSPEAAGASVLAFHVVRYRHSDEAAWRAAIDLGRVLVNGRRVHPEQALAAGDELEFHRPPWREPDAPESFTVAFETSMLVVVKPANLQVLPAGPFSARTLLTLVRSSDASRGEAAPAHRLGRGTSGLIAFGKTAQARSSLSRQLRELTLGKTYLAWTCGARLPSSFAGRQPIARVPHGPLTIHMPRRRRGGRR
jgi:23S rRNA pseudouridine1911/1915/1917 synthase